MWSVTPDEQAVSRAFEQESERVVGLVRGSRDLREPVPGLKWDVGRLAAHLTAVYLTFGATMRGGDQDAQLTGAVAAAVAAADGVGGLPATVAAANEYAIAQLAVESPQAAADGLAANAEALLAALAGQDDLARELDAPWYGEGMTRSVGMLASLAVTESLVHGRDLARALRGDTRMSQASAAAATPTVMSAMLPLLLDADRAKGLAADYEVRLRGGAGFRMRIADGAAKCSDPREPAERNVDCVISLDPRAALLVGFGRTSLARAIAGGGALSTGRRPWLGLRFSSLFATP